MKRCTQCGEVKPLGAFYKNKHSHPCSHCKACHNQFTARWKKDPKNKNARQRIAWRSRLKYNYGLTEDAYVKLLEWSGGGCAICGERPGLEHRKKKLLCVDHNHTTGAVRGLLCENCNLGLGKFKDSKNLLRVAIAYLEYFDPREEGSKP